MSKTMQWALREMEWRDRMREQGLDPEDAEYNESGAALL